MTRLFIIIAISILISSCATDATVYKSQYDSSPRYQTDSYSRNYHGGYRSYRSYSRRGGGVVSDSRFRGYRHHGFGHHGYRHHSYGSYSRYGYGNRGYRRRGY